MNVDIETTGEEKTGSLKKLYAKRFNITVHEL